MYEIVELYKYICFLVLYINLGGYFYQLEINFFIKDEEEIVRNMVLVIDEYFSVRIVFFGIFLVFDIMLFYIKNILMLV